MTHQTPIHAHWRHNISDNSTAHISISVHCAELATYLNLSYCKPYVWHFPVYTSATSKAPLVAARPNSRRCGPHVFPKLNVLNSAEYFKTISIFCNIQLFISQKRPPFLHLCGAIHQLSTSLQIHHLALMTTATPPCPKILEPTILIQYSSQLAFPTTTLSIYTPSISSPSPRRAAPARQL